MVKLDDGLGRHASKFYDDVYDINDIDGYIMSHLIQPNISFSAASNVLYIDQTLYPLLFIDIPYRMTLILLNYTLFCRDLS